MDCLADEDVPLDAVRGLRVSGHASRENRVVLTFDCGYGGLLFGEMGEPVPPGIVYFRFDPSPPEEPADLLLALLEHADFSVSGVLTDFERDRVRQRPLPEAR